MQPMPALVQPSWICGTLRLGGDQQVVGPDRALLGRAGVAALDPGRIGLCRAQLVPDLLGGLEHADGVALALAHLGVAVQAQHARGCREQGLALGEGLPVARVEVAGHLAGELHVLDLVLAHGHDLALVDEDVRGLQHGVVQQADVHGGPELVALVLELRHALQLPERRDGVEDPREVGVARHLGLHEEDGLVQSRPQAYRDVARSMTLRGMSAARRGWSMACRSTTEMNEVYSCCRRTQLAIAPK